MKAFRRFDRLARSERGDGDLERLRRGGFAGFADDIGPILREKLEALSMGVPLMLAMRAVKPGFSSSDFGESSFISPAVNCALMTGGGKGGGPDLPFLP